MRPTVLKAVHLLALGLWVGGAAFFNFVTAPTVFDTFKQVVDAGPSDRTAHLTIIDPAAKPEARAALASALAGSAVGPVFPRYYAWQGVCGVAAMATALAWWRLGGVHRWRVVLLALALAGVACGWPLSEEVSRLRVERFAPEKPLADAARVAFGPWHLASLGLSTATVALAGVALLMGAKLPADERTVGPGR